VKDLLVTFGTRPEAIKMAPVVKALRGRPDAFRVRVCVTAQHRDMLDQVLSLFGIVPDVDLHLMRPGQSPAELLSRALGGMTDTIRAGRTDLVLVHGDTTTALATTLAAFHLQVPVAHVEAGLRSHRMDAPFPEEMNRVVIDRLASLHLAPTPLAERTLRAEGLPADGVLVTGNTAIDALLDVRARLAELPLALPAEVLAAPRLVLVTAHRRESFGAPIREVFAALAALARSHPDTTFVYPVHRNPEVDGPARELLREENLRLLPPVGYAETVALLDRSLLVLTDSGGIQEEAATLGRPVLVLREVTERPELVEAGAGLLVGTDRTRIEREAARLLADSAARARMGGGPEALPRALFGDGHASRRIAARLAGEPVAAWTPSA
jgi:UDP-N-acetylglucosamine 2-epimerase (non-hydrolysing)